MGSLSGISQINGVAGSARVSVFNTETHALAGSTLSDGSGNWSLKALPKGVYEALYLATGYQGVFEGPWAIEADPYWVHYVSLLHFDGTDASTTFTDQAGRVWTAVGNAQIDTAQSKFGGASALFDGAGDYVTTPASADMNVIAGDFTVELWVRPTANPGATTVIVGQDDGQNGSQNFHMAMNTTGTVYWAGFSTSSRGSAWTITSPSALTLNVWTHIAVTRSGSTTRLFINGVMVASTTNGYWAGSTTIQTVLGNWTNGGTLQVAGNALYAGHMEELRIVKGQAVYTEDFTPATVAHPNGRTVSLLHMDGADGSTTFTDAKGRAWTRTGTVIDTDQSKFGGASALFSGAQNLAAVASSDFAYGTGDFTWELWFRASVTSDNDYMLDHGSNGGSLTLSANTVKYYNVTTNTVSPLYTGVVVNPGTWYHLAIARQSGTTRMFLNGVLVASGADAHNYPAQTLLLGDYGGTGFGYSGWLDEVRITHGAARYTADFVPPATACIEEL